MADALCIDDHVMGLADPSVVDDVVDDLLLVIVILLGKKDVLRAGGDTAPESDIACMAAHDLDDGASLMGRGGILYLVDGVHGRIDGGVEADGVVGAGDIQVDGAGNADGVDAVSGQSLGSAVGAVAADDDDAVNAILSADLGALGLPFLRTEFRAPGRAQNGSAGLDDPGHVPGPHLIDLLVQKAPVAPFDAHDLYFAMKSFSYDRTNGRIHAGRIAAAGQYADGFDLFAHFSLPDPRRQFRQRCCGTSSCGIPLSVIHAVKYCSLRHNLRIYCTLNGRRFQ